MEKPTKRLVLETNGELGIHYEEEIRKILNESTYVSENDYYLTIDRFYDLNSRREILKYTCIVLKQNETEVETYTNMLMEILKEYRPRVSDYSLLWNDCAVYMRVK